MIPMSTILNPKHRGLFSSPRGTARGKKDRKVFQGEWVGCWGLEKGRRAFFIIIKDSNHATNFEPCVIRYLQRHPEINTLVSQASQVEEKCFRSKRPNFASKNAFSPSAALRAAACKARVALGRVWQEKSQNKSPEATPRGFVLAPPAGLEPATP